MAAFSALQPVFLPLNVDRERMDLIKSKEWPPSINKTQVAPINNVEAFLHSS